MTIFQQTEVIDRKDVFQDLISTLEQETKSISLKDGLPLPIFSHPQSLEKQFEEAYQHFIVTARETHITSYEGEWFLDNYYIIQQAVQQIQEDMPSDYYRQLPKLAEGEMAGYPRIYVLAHALSHFFNYRITPQDQSDFIDEYQEHTVLSTAELWAWPTMLRVVAIETLSLMLLRLLSHETLGELTPTPIYKRFRLEGSPDFIVGNCVTSLRTVNTQNWKDFFEAASYIEAILRNDPTGTYEKMDFQTRNRYREMVEHLSKHSKFSEEEVASTALKLSQTEPISHIGYYLIDKGLKATKKTIGYQQGFRESIREYLFAWRLTLYLSIILLITALIIFVLGKTYAETVPQIMLVSLLAFIPAITIAVHVVNHFVARTVAPHTLAKMDFSAGIPDIYRTMVVIPALLTDREEMDSLTQQLEQHYLRNEDRHLTFAILADYPDADSEQLPTDQALLEYATEQITNLNKRYTHEPFYFFLRARQWNASERKWMGYERKRGKLSEFNQLILHPNVKTSYSVQIGQLSILPDIRYVITLDADTILPRDSAQRLVGVMAHPLNQAQFDADGRIIRGYSILQPRVEILPTVAGQTPFTRIFASESGLDLYTLAVSDVYNDLFAEGSYVGKGIYDVAAFERSLSGKVPDNTLLSHDLFEGISGRATLVTDVVLFEDYPTGYLVHIKRLHRWVRGDWQLLPWLLPRVPSAEGGTEPNRFSPLGLWKVIDNLRRSLIQPTLLLLILASWLGLLSSAWAWTAFALFTLLMPFLLSVVNRLDAMALDPQMSLAQHRGLRVSLAQWILSIVFLPYEAFIRIDAIIVTLHRLITRQHLLEWTSSASVNRLFQGQALNAVWRQMAPVLLIVSLITGFAVVLNPANAGVALPLLFVWWLSPAIANYISRPLKKVAETLTDAQRLQLRSLARRNWLFFEEFVGPDDNWLPPDHYQQAPIADIGHYTSPTNIGLMLLSTLAAYDLGYIGILDFVTRLQLSFESIGRLERYQGHLLNWYNTQTLQPLLPRYVSTVDNGNFVGSLLSLKQGCIELWQTPILREDRWHSILDTLMVLSQIIDLDPELHDIDVSQATQQQLSAMYTAIEMLPQHEWIAQLDHFTAQYWKPVSDSISQLAENHTEVRMLRDVRIYLYRLYYHLSTMRRDLDMLLPWHTAFQNTPAIFRTEAFLEHWEAFYLATSVTVTLGNANQVYKQVQKHLKALQAQSRADSEAQKWCTDLLNALANTRNITADLAQNLRRVQAAIDSESNALDFGILYNEERNLFHIGYNVEAEQLDNSYYDLLASEARLASFLAIARREVSQKHWLQLSRPIALVQNKQTLLSWSGTMFEYLMPLLFMRNYEGTLLHQSYETVIEAQIRYTQGKNIPWGISESGYYAFDNNQKYQYRAFGLPTVAFKRGQERDMVITPYASMLALPLAPLRVMQNIERLIQQHALTAYGFVEALDYTLTRLPPDQEMAQVQEFMTHHQGMSFLSLANYLNDNLMVQRFHRDPRVQSVELLLMEKIPDEPILEHSTQLSQINESPRALLANNPWEVSVTPDYPQAYYLSNGHYAVMITSSGGGYSQWQNRALTRWRADSTLDEWGQWLYIQDEDSGAIWSPTYQPCGEEVDWSKAMFHLRHAEFQARAFDISSQVDVLVPNDADLEIRKLRLINHSEHDRHLKVSSYSEMVMAPQASDQRHQAFNKLFIESEYLPDLQALLFQRRLRSVHDEPLFVLQMLVMPTPINPQYETDRGHFLGRNRSSRNPQMQLKGSTGATLDPIMALAQTLTIPAHSTIELAFITLAGNKREALQREADQYHQWDYVERAFSYARFDSNREIQHLGITIEDIARFQNLLSSLLYPNPKLRAAAPILATNSKSQPSLWNYGISGDYPIVLVQITEEDQLDLVYDLLQAHRFWRNRGFASSLVILNMNDTGYMQERYNQIHNLLVTLGSETWLNRHDGVFILRSEQLNEADRTLLQSAARVFLNGENGTLEQQLDRQTSESSFLPTLIPSSSPEDIVDTSLGLSRPADLQFDNGLGGFSADGREYVLYISRAATTPAPWINVIANAEGGFTFSEAGAGFSWGQNSGENRMTNWRNDPVTDMPSEAIYLRDEETTFVWSPTLMPAGTDAPYLVRHGMGYSIVEHHSQGLTQTVSTYMAPEDAVKFVRLRLKNTATRPRRITITYYMEWVLGPVRDMTQQYLIPELDTASQTVLVHNPYSMEFSDYHAFLTSDQPFHGITSDRTEFLGRMGSYAAPSALRRLGLSNRIEAGLDPCTALQVHVDLPVGGENEVCFIMGSGHTRAEALTLSQHYRDGAAIQQAYEMTLKHWRDTVDSIVLRTPDASMNTLLPWLLYQSLACRVWGRSGLYQSSGAYGFRDQLQDVLSLIHVRPDLAREHILRAARHQFEAGDVLHWWHPPPGRGVRTRFSDDLVWLPYVASLYVEMTGDESLLDEEVVFLKGEPLRPEEEERYGFYEPTAQTYSIYEHCQRALNKSYDLGRHKLPLMKAGDWNDGMNRVGIHGQGESVWMGWFLYTTMDKFSQHCQTRGDYKLVATYQERMQGLKEALEQSAWDGEWYLRAFYDDGTPLGSHQNAECKIDSLGQSWGVLSGAARPDRAAQAMQSVEKHLINFDDALIQLFNPPFDNTRHDPGYIKGYSPGIRENGGQYTHAALWVLWAFAEMGKGDFAARLFNLLNPINHSDTASKTAQYRVEPYVIAADVYSTAPHTGRGGWTWYTGSAGWMYRVAVEAILGIQRKGDHLLICPRTTWPHYEVDYRYGQSIYKITILNPNGVENGSYEVTLDGQNCDDNQIPLFDDGQVHEIMVQEISNVLRA